MNFKGCQLLITLLFIFSLVSCAKRGRPTGGPLDETAPLIVTAIPNQESTNFKTKKIKIYFDEYIKLKDVKKNLVISPPQKNEPIITPVGTPSKFITIKILDTLDANTTYLFNFGNSVVDNNEENVFQNFKYIFSTGTYIDSLFISGEVTDPLVKKPEKEIDVMLYEYDSTFTDSIIFKQKPRYITSTLDSTLFELTNLRSGKYLLIALKDGNNNKIFDPKVDKIGFVNDTVTLPTNKTYSIKLFKEVPELRVFKPKEISKGHLTFGYEGDASDLNINILTPVPNDFKFEINYEENKDTINYYYTPIEVDSINFIVSKGIYVDSLTLKTRLKDIDSLKIRKSVQSYLPQLDTFFIGTNNPIVTIDTSKIKIAYQDSIPVDFNAIISTSKTKLYLNFEKDFDAQYNFEILPNALQDVFGFSNDSLSFKVKTKKPEDYGIITFNLTSTKKSSFIVELLDQKGVTIRKVNLKEPKTIKFSYLDPNNYLIRVTIDANNNGVWDTGNYIEKRQPEEILFFDQLIELKSNWDLDYSFNID